jgi:hypothetical protein
MRKKGAIIINYNKDFVRVFRRKDVGYYKECLGKRILQKKTSYIWIINRRLEKNSFYVYSKQQAYMQIRAGLDSIVFPLKTFMLIPYAHR